MKKTHLFFVIIFLLLFVSVNSQAAGRFSIKGYDIYFFGIDINALEDSNYLSVAGGVAASFAVHTAGHWLYATSQGLPIRQSGLNEQLGSSDQGHIRKFCQSGFALQNMVGLILTSLPQTRYSDFTKGYVAAAFLEINSYPALWTGSDFGDLKVSGLNGGNEWGEYAVYLSIASYNTLRIKKMSLDESFYGKSKHEDAVPMTIWAPSGTNDTLSRRGPLLPF